MYIGDDYHYFTGLNLIFNNILREIRGQELPFKLKPSRALKSQIIGMLFNLPIFAIFTFVWNRRIALLGVRIWNRLLIFAVTPVFLAELSLYSGFKPGSSSLYFLVTLIFVGLFPGPISPAIGGALFFNCFEKKHLWKSGYINGLLRSFVLETVFSIYVIQFACLFHYFNANNHTMLIVLSIIFALVSISLYAPMAICFTLVIAFLNLQLNGFASATLLILLLLSSLLIIRKYIHGDEFGKEVLDEEISYQSALTFGFWNILEFFLVSLFPLLCILSNIINLRFFNLFVIMTIFVLFNFTTLHNFSRIWFRGASPFYQLFATYIIVKSLSLSNTFIFAGIILGLTIYLQYFVTQAKFLLKCGYFELDQKLNSTLLLTNKPPAVSLSDSEIFTTNPKEIMLIGLYSDAFAQNIPHGVGSSGFESQLRHLAKAFKIARRPKSEFLNVFDCECNYFEWMKMRNENYLDARLHSIVASYQLQFLCTYMTYNNALNLRGLRRAGSWTFDFEKLLEEIWDSEAVF